MKALILIMLLTSCTTTIKSPITQFEYTGYIKEEGVGISLKPPLWGAGVRLYESLTNKDKDDE
jgi:hypothetical protein